jgi:hypothetical protein
MKEGGGTAGNLTVDIQKTLNVSDYNWTSIEGTAKANMSAANFSTGSNMTGWNTTIKAGEWLKPVFSVNDTVKSVTLEVYATKT